MACQQSECARRHGNPYGLNCSLGHVTRSAQNQVADVQTQSNQTVPILSTPLVVLRTTPLGTPFAIAAQKAILEIAEKEHRVACKWWRPCLANVRHGTDNANSLSQAGYSPGRDERGQSKER